MVYTTEYASPLGPITLACDEDAIIGLWFNGQRYFGNILPEQTEQKEQPLFADAKRWLDVYFSGRAPDFLPPLFGRIVKLQQLLAAGIGTPIGHPRKRRLIASRYLRRMLRSAVGRIHPAVDLHQLLCQIGTGLAGKRVRIVRIHEIKNFFDRS